MTIVEFHRALRSWNESSEQFRAFREIRDRGFATICVPALAAEPPEDEDSWIPWTP